MWMNKCEDVNHSTYQTVHTYREPRRWLSKFVYIVLPFLKALCRNQSIKMNQRVYGVFQNGDCNENFSCGLNNLWSIRVDPE